MSPPLFLLPDSSIHAQIISQLEGGDIIMQINDSKECFKEYKEHIQCGYIK